MDHLPPNLPSDFFVKKTAFTKKQYRDVYSAIDPANPCLSQRGKVIIITGASRGLGRQGFAASFAKAGPKAIVLLARSASNLAQTEKAIKALDPTVEVLSLSTDVSNERSVNDTFQHIKEKFGAADVLINNAGKLAPLQRIGEADVASWWGDFEVNVRGTFIVTKAFLNLVGPNPAQKTTIISVTSAGAYAIFPNHSSYALSKLVVSQFNSYLAAEHPTITCVSLHPGMVPTDMGGSVAVLAPFMKDTPELVGSTAVWLASGDRAFLSGRYVSANWDVQELEERKDEIIADDKLKTLLKGEFGTEQFP